MYEAPIICPIQRVDKAWIDYNGHMNMAYYNLAFDRGVDHIYDLLDIGAAYARSGAGSCFILEAHVNYLQELVLDDPIEIRFRLLDWDVKRLHYFEEMYHAEQGYLAATSEQLAMHVDMQTRRAAPFPEATQAEIAALFETHEGMPPPEQVGRVIGIPGKK